MFDNLFKKKEYLDCHFMKHSLHFFYDSIKACSTNIPGPIFYPDYKGEKVDWDYIYKQRIKFIKKINSPFFKSVPDFCKDCSDVFNCLSNKPVEPFKNEINKLYFHNNFSCNAKCIYCTYAEYQKGYRYKVLPLVKELIEKQILSCCSHVYMSGGEMTIYPEFEELLSLLSQNVYSRIEILTSGIKYCKSIEESFKKDRCILIISLDSSNKETYKKIKLVDCFDTITNNIKNYVKESENAKENIILKYIIVDDINDTNEQIINFINLADSLQVRKVRLDFDYNKYKFARHDKVPQKYFELYSTFNDRAKELGLKIETCDQIEEILKNSK